MKFNQTISVFASGNISASGQQAHANGVEVAGRWEYEREVFQDVEGHDQVSDAKAFFLKSTLTEAGLAPALEDRMQLGAYAGAAVGAQTTLVVKKISETPNRRAGKTLVKVWLV
mgnify:CR=1 FL=1